MSKEVSRKCPGGAYSGGVLAWASTIEPAWISIGISSRANEAEANAADVGADLGDGSDVDDEDGGGDAGGPEHPEAEQSSYIHLRGLPWEATEQEVAEWFAEAPGGPIKVARVLLTCKESGRKSGESVCCARACTPAWVHH